MKYINFKDIGIVIFGDHVKHDTMRQIIGREAISAGRFRADSENALCSGESVSLGLKSLPEDTTWVQHFIDR